MFADDYGLQLEPWGDDTLDVLFDGRRIWSIAPGDHPLSRSGKIEIAWPPELLSRLDGTAHVEIRSHLDGRPVVDSTIAFGSGSGSVDLTDARGRPLSLTKWGRFNNSFESSSRESVEGYLDDLEWLIKLLADECGIQAYISYGTLLGAVRGGKVIAHDVDADIGYLSAFTEPVDAVRESMRIERILRRAGIRVLRQSGMFLAVFFRQKDGSVRNLDIFAAFLRDGWYHQVPEIRFQAELSDILPLREIELEGRRFPAPANPEKYLAATYGPEWATPDPAFSFQNMARTSAIHRQQGAWFGALRQERAWWHQHLSSTPPATEPSDFAQWVLPQVGRQTSVLDVGCGHGVDSRAFMRKGHRVLGLDFTNQTGRMFRSSSAERTRSEYVMCNLYSMSWPLKLAAQLSREPGRRAVYARRLFNDLRPDGRDSFWRFASMTLRGGGLCFVETTGTPAGPAASRADEFPTPAEVLIAEAQRHGATLVRRTDLKERVTLRLRARSVSRLVLRW